MVIPWDAFFYPTFTRLMDSFFLLTTGFIHLFQNKLSEVPEYAKMQFHMMTLLDVLGKVTWARKYFLSQGIILIRCARTCFIGGVIVF